MKKTIFLLLSLIILTACAGLKTPGKNMAEDPGSPEKIAMLRDKANDFWKAFVKEDYEKVYSIYDPFFRARFPDKSATIGKMMGKIKYHNFEVKDIRAEGNVAKVKLSVVYSVPEIKMKTQVFSAPNTSTEFEETWLYIYDNWYKEYVVQMMEGGYVDY
jgi:hypothetical protein